MHPPQHITKAIEAINPNVRLGWTHEKFAEVPEDGAFALLDLYPSNCQSKGPYCRRPCAEHTFELLWNQNGPVFGSKYDTAMEVPVVKGFVSPQKVFNGDVVEMVRVKSMRAREFDAMIRKKNEKLAAEKRYKIKQMAGEIGQDIYRRSQRSTDAGVQIANKHITAEEKAKSNGDWEASVTERPAIGVSGVGLT